MDLGMACVGYVGGYEAGALALVEPTLKYHPCRSWVLTYRCNPAEGHCMVGSLTGAVASQSVTEAREGPLRLSGNQPSSAKA